MSKKTLEKIILLLKEKSISFKQQQHKTIEKSSQAASKIRGTKLSDGAKALIMKTKSGKFIQVILPADKKANMKAIKQLIGEKNISLASPDEVFMLTDCIVGSVPPCGALWNIPVYADKTLLEKEEVVFSAGTLEDSVFINPVQLLKINNAQVADISKE